MSRDIGKISNLRRVRSHKIAAENLRKLLEKEGDYDLIYAEIPPNDVALAAAEYAHRNKIPFVADVNDLWPEAMRMVFDIPIVSDLLFLSAQKGCRKGVFADIRCHWNIGRIS